MRTPARTLTAALILTAVVGCSAEQEAGSAGSRTSGPPTAAATKNAAEKYRPQRLPLPIYDYKFTPEENAVVDRATDIAMSSCMSRYGYSLKTTEPTITLGDRRYGVIDLYAARQYGYHVVTRGASSDVQNRRFSEDEASAMTGGLFLDAVTGEFHAIPGYSGPVTELNGERVPKGGCSAEARRELLGRESLRTHADIVSDIDTTSFARSQKVPVVAKALAEWSVCMKSEGYSYATPLESISAVNLDEPGADKSEVRLATADVECKKKVGLVKIWSAAEAEIQGEMILASRQPLQQQKQDNDTTLRNARSLIAAHPDS
ncbi:hypothetical protein [Streptomyces adelaidensis]|uniref:hypothetical protein n=1 Tax=Streptomyces adelaidensis TaxID=2796465 RepID=UPI001908C4A7|nr:hypothetical protein [Streptomyces adelaidensis]